MTPQQAKACTDIIACTAGLDHFQRISVFTLLLGASINDASKTPESATSLLNLTEIQLRRHVRGKATAEGLG